MGLGTWDLGLRTWTWDVGRGTEHGIFSKTKPNYSGTKSRNISRVGSNRYKPKNRWRVSPRVSKRQWIDAFKIIQDYIWSFFWKNFFSAYMVVLRLFSEYRVTQTTDCLWSEQRAERETREKTYKRRRDQTDWERERELHCSLRPIPLYSWIDDKFCNFWYGIPVNPKSCKTERHINLLSTTCDASSFYPLHRTIVLCPLPSR